MDQMINMCELALNNKSTSIRSFKKKGNEKRSSVFELPADQK